MTKKLLVRQGGGAASEVDFAAFAPRKGAAFLDQNTPLLQMGQRFANGEAAQGYFKVVDPAGELPSDGFRLRPWAEVRLTDDASGDELTLAWMRLSAGDVARNGPTIAGDEIEHSPQLMDCNLDLRGIPFVNQWHRDAETDQERLEALQARKLNGSASTDAVFRDTTDITIAGFSAGHLCDFAVDTDLDARNYQAGTEVLDVIAEIAEQAGKIFGVVLHHDGGSTHKCLLYIDQDNLSSWTSAVRISDDVADWDPDDNTAPTFEPHWVQGSGKEGNFEPVVSGLVGIYGGSDDDTHTVFVDTGEAQEDQEVFVGVYNDDKSETATQATRRANWQLTDRKRPFFSNRVSVIVRADQAHLVEAGQAIETKSVVFESGNLKDTFVWRRVAQKILEPLPDGRYWMHLQLERPRMTSGPNGGATQPKGTSPKPTPEFEPDPGDSVEKFFNANDAGGDAENWTGNLPNQGGGANGTSFYNFKSNAPNEFQTTWAAAAGSTYRIEGYVNTSSQGQLVFVFTSAPAGSAGVSGLWTLVLDSHTISPAQPNSGNSWVFFTAGPFTAPTGTTSAALGRTAAVSFDELTVYLVDSGVVDNDEHAIDYGDFPHDSPHFLPSDYVEARLDDLQTQISALPESVRNSLKWKVPVRVASTANGTLSTAFENGDTLDGVTLATGDRILLKDQSTGADRGIYVVNASGAPTRATDMDDSAEVGGAVVLVMEGTANADKIYVCTTNEPITLGTTSLTFTALSGGGGSLTVQEDDSTVDAAATTLDFTTALNVTSSPSGEANIAVDLGTGSTQAAAGDHTHTAGDSAKASASSDLAPTTGTAQDITGATLSLAAGTYIVAGNFQVEINSGDRVFEGILDVAGSDENDLAIWEAIGADDGDEQQVVQFWRIALGSTSTVKLQARHSGGSTGDFDVKAANTTITAWTSGGTAGAWTTYTPTWTASTTNPTLGSTTITGRYRLLDSKTVAVQLAIVITTGGAWNAGSGSYAFSLPAGMTSATGRKQVGAGYVLDSGTAHLAGTAKINAGATTFEILIAGAANPRLVANASPITWATGDEIEAHFLLEIQ